MIYSVAETSPQLQAHVDLYREGDINTATAADVVFFDNRMLPDDIIAGVLAYTEVFRRFYDHPYGQYLAGQDLRFSKHFGYEPRLMRHDLGLDADPLGHNALAYLYAGIAVHRQQQVRPVDRHEAAIALLAAGIHDMGESMHPGLEQQVGAVIGDMPMGCKTDADRAVEAAVRGVQYGLHLSDLPDHFVGRVEAAISHDDHQSAAAQLLEASHGAGSLSTVVRAGRIVLFERNMTSLREDSERWQRRVRQLEALARLGMVKAVELLEPYADEGIVIARTMLEASAEMRHRIAGEIDLPTEHAGYQGMPRSA